MLRLPQRNDSAELNNSQVSILSHKEFARAKTPRTPSPEVYFLCGLCAFARDIPSSSCGSAGLYCLWLTPLRLNAEHSHEARPGFPSGAFVRLTYLEQLE
jgi:hypothetical protein